MGRSFLFVLSLARKIRYLADFFSYDTTELEELPDLMSLPDTISHPKPLSPVEEEEADELELSAAAGSRKVQTLSKRTSHSSVHFPPFGAFGAFGAYLTHLSAL